MRRFPIILSSSMALFPASCQRGMKPLVANCAALQFSPIARAVRCL
jgi:hypothetical protein